MIKDHYLDYKDLHHIADLGFEGAPDVPVSFLEAMKFIYDKYYIFISINFDVYDDKNPIVWAINLHNLDDSISILESGKENTYFHAIQKSIHKSLTQYCYDKGTSC